MYSVEFDHDEVCITVVDDTGVHGDLRVHAFDDLVYLTQYDQDLNQEYILEINPDMWEQLIMAIHSPEGVFLRK
jgi:hypothetical protein